LEDKLTIHGAIDKMFEQVDVNEDDKVSFKEFSQWCYQNMTPGLVTWIWEIMPREKSLDTNVPSPKSKKALSPSFSVWDFNKIKPKDEESLKCILLV
jgi:hypothetical protein